MLVVQSSLFAIALAVCALCSAIAARSGSPLRTRFFVAYLALELAGFIAEWLMLHPGSPFKALWLTLVMGLSLLVAPCLWLLARELTERKRPQLAELWPGHCLPVLAAWALLLPLLLQSHWGTTFANPQAPASPAKSLWIHGTMLLAIAIFTLQVPYYLRRISHVLERHNHSVRTLFAKAPQGPLLALRWLVVVVATNWLISLGRTLHCLLLGEDFGFGLLFTAVEVLTTCAVLLLVIRQTLPLSQADQALLDTLGPSGDSEAANPKPRYRHSGLSDKDATRIADKIQHALEVDQLYLRDDLSLRLLSQHINETPRYVTQVINESLNTRFYEMVHRYRVRHVANQLKAEPASAITELAFAAGFNSKSTFHSAFKRELGMTPGEYRNS